MTRNVCINLSSLFENIDRLTDGRVKDAIGTGILIAHLFDVILYVPVNSFSVMLRPVFLG